MSDQAPTPGRPTYPVLEIGGTHVTAAMVVPDADPFVDQVTRRPVEPDAPADRLLARFIEAGRGLDAPDRSAWGVALPGPFDYSRGIGRYRDVSKFDALNGVDVGAALRDGLASAGGRVAFINDANAFLLGEHVAGAARDHERVIGLTLGTGVGSAFVDGGRFVEDGPNVPPEGRVDLLTYAGAPLEEAFSRRAIQRRYGEATADRSSGGVVPDVRDIAASARAGDAVAASVLRGSSRALALCLAPWVERFAATAVVIGGSMALSWDVLRPGFVAGLMEFSPSMTSVRVLRAERLHHAALIGAARYAEKGAISTA